jgi:hypothetical protein
MINWQRVTLNLRKSCGSLSQVHRRTGVDVQHLRRLARGEVKDPRFTAGVRLLDLHLDVCPNEHSRENLWN